MPARGDGGVTAHACRCPASGVRRGDRARGRCVAATGQSAAAAAAISAGRARAGGKPGWSPQLPAGCRAIAARSPRMAPRRNAGSRIAAAGGGRAQSPATNTPATATAAALRGSGPLADAATDPICSSV